MIRQSLHRMIIGPGGRGSQRPKEPRFNPNSELRVENITNGMDNRDMHFLDPGGILRIHYY